MVSITKLIRGSHTLAQYRVETKRRLVALTRRLCVEAGLDHLLANLIVPKSVIKSPTGAVGVIRRAWHRYRSQAGAPVSSHGTDVVVAVAGERLRPRGFATSPRREIAALLTPVDRRDSTPLRNAVEQARTLYLFDPVMESSFWTDYPGSGRDGVCVVDGGQIAVALLRHPTALLASVFRVSVALAQLVFTRSLSKESASRVVAAVVLTSAYDQLIGQMRSPEVVLLTSNALATEALRVHALHDTRCRAVYEVQHGVPPLWEADYLHALVEADTRTDLIKRHVIVPQITQPAFGLFERMVSTEQGPINCFLNRHLMDAGSSERLAIDTIAEWQKAITDSGDPEDRLVIAVTGKTDWFGDQRSASMTSPGFEIERRMIEEAHGALTEAKRRFMIVYAPHPLLPVEEVQSHAFFKRLDIRVLPRTVSTWLGADACLSLYSSTLFEARHFGLPAFTPIVPSDDIYDRRQLDFVEHPREGEAWVDAVRRFVVALPARNPSALTDRIHQRLERCPITFGSHS